MIATIALFVALGGVGAYADNEFTGANIKDGSLTGQDVFDNTISGNDITNNSVTGTDVKDGSLTAKDVGENEFVNFPANIGTVGAHACVERSVTGVNAQGDHLLLTPQFEDSDPRFIYTPEYHPSTDSMEIEVCNTGDRDVNDAITHFNLLVFQH